MTQISKVPVIVLSLILVGTVVSEIVLLRQNLELKQKIRIHNNLEGLLAKLQAKADKIAYEMNLQGKCLPIFSQRQEDGQTNGILEKKKSRYSIVFCFSMNDCDACLRSEIMTWNKFAASYDARIFQVIGILDTTDLRENLEKTIHSLRIKFPVLGIANLRSQLNIKSTPAVFFCDGNSKKIIYAYFPTPTEVSHNEFANKLQMVLEACKE
jgi:hypothetical protein